MIKSGIKNYFVNLKYYFTPVGTLFVGAVIGLSILIPNALAAISSMIEEVMGIIEETHVDFNTVKEYIVNSITSLDWTNPISSLLTLISPDWLKSVLEECFHLVSVELQPYGDAIGEAVNGAISTIKALFGVFISFCTLGLICGYFLTKILVRRNMARRTLSKFILALIAESVVSSAIMILCGWLFRIWKPSIAISSVISLLIYAVFSLLMAYIVYNEKKIKFKDVLNTKNFFLLLAADLIILAISMTFMTVLTLITNKFCGIMLGFAFVEIALLVISMNAENYVINLLPKADTADPDKDGDGENGEEKAAETVGEKEGGEAINAA